MTTLSIPILFLVNFLLVLGINLLLPPDHFFLFILKCGLVAHFTILCLKREAEAVSLFFAMTIICGANGRFHQTWGGLPLSVIFLAVLCARIIFSRSNRNYLLQRVRGSILSLPLVLGGLVVPFIGMMGGLWRGNNGRFLIENLDGWVFYLSFFCLLGLIRTKKQGLSFVLTVILSIAGQALMVISLALCYNIDLLSYRAIQQFLYNLLGLGGHLESLGFGILRIYTGNGIFLTFAFTVTLLLALQSRGTRIFFWLSSFFLVFSSLLYSSTRGYWVSGGLSLFLALLYRPYGFRHSGKVKITIVTMLILLLVVGGGFYSPEKVKAQWDNIQSSLEAYDQQGRVVDPERQISSIMVKVFQYRAIIEYTLKDPYFGYGFGAVLPGNVTFRCRWEVDPNPHIFEASYADLFMKVGLVGLLLWLFMIFSIFRRARGVVRRDDMYISSVVVGFSFSLLGTLVTFGTNPYLYSPFGIMPIVVTAFIIEQAHHFRTFSSAHGVTGSGQNVQSRAE